MNPSSREAKYKLSSNHSQLVLSKSAVNFPHEVLTKKILQILETQWLFSYWLKVSFKLSFIRKQSAGKLAEGSVACSTQCLSWVGQALSDTTETVLHGFPLWRGASSWSISLGKRVYFLLLLFSLKNSAFSGIHTVNKPPAKKNYEPKL